MCVNAVQLATMLGKDAAEVASLKDELPAWTVVIGLAGAGYFPAERVQVQELDLKRVVQQCGVTLRSGLSNIGTAGLAHAFEGYSGETYYKLKHFLNFEIGPYTTEEQSALSDNFTWLNTLSWTHGAHQFRFGGEIDRVTLRRNLPIADNGYVWFIPVGPPTANTDLQNFTPGFRFLVKVGAALATTITAFPAMPGSPKTTIAFAKT